MNLKLHGIAIVEKINQTKQIVNYIAIVIASLMLKTLKNSHKLEYYSIQFVIVVAVVVIVE